MDRLDQLIAIEDIKRLKSQYIQCIDGKLWDRMEQTIWTKDATFDVRAGGQKDVEGEGSRDDKFKREGLVTGRANIMALMKTFAPPGMVSVHIGYMPDIEILSETTATGIWGLEDTVTWESGIPYRSLHGFGHWHDTYERIDGRWMKKSSRITRIRIDVS